MRPIAVVELDKFHMKVKYIMKTYSRPDLFVNLTHPNNNLNATIMQPSYKEADAPCVPYGVSFCAQVPQLKYIRYRTQKNQRGAQRVPVVRHACVLDSLE